MIDVKNLKKNQILKSIDGGHYLYTGKMEDGFLICQKVYITDRELLVQREYIKCKIGSPCEKSSIPANYEQGEKRPSNQKNGEDKPFTNDHIKALEHIRDKGSTDYTPPEIKYRLDQVIKKVKTYSYKNLTLPRFTGGERKEVDLVIGTIVLKTIASHNAGNKEEVKIWQDREKVFRGLKTKMELYKEEVK